MKVEAIKGYKFNNIDFAGKKQKKQTQPHVTSPMKAVPVIVLMAMSPINAPLTSAHPIASASPQTEVVANKDKVIQALEIKNASPNYGDCILELISTDGDDSRAEKVALSFKDESDYMEDHYANIYDLQGLCIYQNGFGVSGTGKCQSFYYDNYGDVKHQRASVKEKVTVEISEQFFNFLYQNFGKSLPCVVDKSNIKIFD